MTAHALQSPTPCEQPGAGPPQAALPCAERYARIAYVLGLVAATGFSPTVSWLGSALAAAAAGALLLAAPAVAPLAAAAAALGVYVAFAAMTAHAALLAAGALLVAGLALVEQRRGSKILGLAAGGVSLAGVALVLVRAGFDAHFERLVALSTGLLFGVSVWLAAAKLGAGRGRPAWLTRLLPRPSKPAPCPSVAADSGAARWRGLALVATAAMIPVGEGATFAAAGLLLVSMLARPNEVGLWALKGPAPRAVALAFGAWIGFGLLAYWLGGEGWLQPRELGRLGPFVLMPLVLVAVASLERCWIQRAAAVFVLSLGVASVVALVQFSLSSEASGSVVRFFTAVSSGAQIWVPGERDHMVAGGFYLHRLKMAHVLLLGLAPLAARQLLVPMSGRRRGLELALLALLASALLLTYTRAALLGVGAGSAACMVLASTRWRVAGAAALLVAAAVALAMPSTRERILSMGRPAASSDRALIWSQGVQIIAEHPLGIGLGNYPSVVGRYYDRVAPEANVPRTYPHDLVLAAWAETGAGGLVAYVSMWATLAWTLVRSLRRRSHDAWVRTAAGAGLFALAAFWTVGLTHDVLYHKPVALAFAALVGAVLAAIPEAIQAPAATGAALAEPAAQKQRGA